MSSELELSVSQLEKPEELLESLLLNAMNKTPDLGNQMNPHVSVTII